MTLSLPVEFEYSTQKPTKTQYKASR